MADHVVLHVWVRGLNSHFFVILRVCGGQRVVPYFSVHGIIALICIFIGVCCLLSQICSNPPQLICIEKLFLCWLEENGLFCVREVAWEGVGSAGGGDTILLLGFRFMN